MPYNGNGVFSILNIFLPGTTILSTPVNSNFSDIASGLSDVLTRDGQAGMTAQLKAIAGTVSAPGVSFTNDLTTGMYLSNTGELSFTAAGVRQFLIDATAFRFTTGIAETGVLSPASLGSSQNNYAPTGIDTASTLRITSSLAVNITGMAGLAAGTAPTTGRKIKLINIGSFAITLVANSGSSTAANRFGIPANFTLFAGQACELLYDATSSLWRVIGSFQFVSSTPLGNCQLRIASATVVTLFPYQGNFVTFPSGAVATIASAGISSTFNNASVNGTSGQTLSNTTLYYAYLWDSGGGTYVIDWSTTSHATDTTTGIEIKSGDATRVLIGMAYLIGANFLDSGANRLVASWFNRLNKLVTASYSTGRTTTSTSIVEINSEIRNNFLTWGTAFNGSFAGYVQGTITSTNLTVSIGVDGVVSLPATTGVRIVDNNQSFNGSLAMNYAVAEGFHFITIGGFVSGGTGTWGQGSALSTLIAS